MKKHISKIILSGLLAVSLFSTTAAAIPEKISIDKTIENVIDKFFGILISISVIMIIWSGFEFVFAGGDAEKLKTARQRLTFALTGVAIAFASKGLVALVQTFIK